MVYETEIKVAGKYMGQNYTGTITSIYATSSFDYVDVEIKLDAPITVFALGSIDQFSVNYQNGEYNGARKLEVIIQ